jgi:hypothetical protein
MTVNTRVIKILLESNIGPDIEITEDHRVRILPDITYLPRCLKGQFAAFIADPGLLVVWDDHPDKIVRRIERLEAALIRKFWGEPFEEADFQLENNASKAPLLDPNENDPEVAVLDKPRRILLMQAWLTAATLALTIAALGTGWRQIAIEIAIDGRLLRLLFILASLPQTWLSLVGL